MTAIHFDTELREYYIRRQADGKSKMAIINLIRNKLIARVFAVVKQRIFSKSGLKPNRTFNIKLIKELFGIVAEAA